MWTQAFSAASLPHAIAMLSLPQFSTRLPSSAAPNVTHNTHHLTTQLPLSTKLSATTLPRCVSRKNEEQQLQSVAGKEEEEEYRVLASMRSMYNHILIVDSPTSRMLLLDDTHSVHSVIRKGQIWTNSYWDEFGSLPAIIPPGPIAILGLGGGTVAHLMLNLWPSLQLEGWEIDDILIDQAREHFGLSDLEKRNDSGGILNVHVGDALSPSGSIPGGYAGIIVDLFSEGDVLPQLQEAKTWVMLAEKLMPKGRIMVNCGGSDDGYLDELDDSNISIEREWTDNSTLQAMATALGDQVSWKKLRQANGGNFFALTGSNPDVDSWCICVPAKLSSSVKMWKSIS